MSGQRRDAPTGRYTEHSRSAPEAQLTERAARTPTDLQVLETLDNLTQTFAVIRHIREAGRAAFLADDSIHALAAVGALIRLGEQAKKLGSDFMERHPAPEYRKMGKARDLLAHKYDLDRMMVWQMVAIFAPRSEAAHRDIEMKFEMRISASA